MLQCTLKRVEFCYLHIELVKFAFEQTVGTSTSSKTVCPLKPTSSRTSSRVKPSTCARLMNWESIERVREANAAARPGRFGEQAQALRETRRVRRQAAPRGNLSDAIGVIDKDHNHSMNTGANSRVKHTLEGWGLRASRACRGTRGTWRPCPASPARSCGGQ